jgi:hypothetical protein
LDLPSDKFEGLLFELSATQVGNHDSLVWKVQLLLRADLFPGVLHEQRQAIHRYGLTNLDTREQAIRLSVVEASSELFALLNKLILLIDLVREHGELKVEEVGGLGVLELLRLVDLVPDVVHVLVDDGADALEIVPSVIEVTQHEE